MHEQEPIANQVIKNSFWNFLMMLFGKIGGLIFIILLARFLLPEKFGVYNLAMSITLLLLTLADIGINQTLMRYLSESLKRKNKQKTLLEYKYLFKIKFYLTTIFSGFLILSSYPLAIYIFKKPLLFCPLLFSGIYLFVYSLESFYESFFYIIKKVNYLTIKQFSWELIRIVGTLLIFIFVSSQYHILGIIWILIISTALTLVCLFFYLNRLMPFLFERNTKELTKKDKNRINRFLIYLIIGSSFMVIFGYVDMIMIGIFLPSEFVGFYSAAWALITGFAALISVPNVLLPFFTEMKKEKINEAFEKVFRYTSLIAMPMIFGIFVLGRDIIRLTYGYEYLTAALPLYFLSFLILELPITNSLKAIFYAREKPKFFVRILIISTMMNLVLNYFFITSFLKISMTWAIAGAAMATLLSRFFYFTGLFVHSKSELGIFFNFKFLFKPVLSSLIMSIGIFLINQRIQDTNLFIGIIEVAGGVMVYFGSMYLIKGISKKDFGLIKELFQ